MSRPRPLPEGPAVVGIVNLTPDSFSDGGRLASPEAARDRALGMIEDGAAALDLGAESTRPGAAEVPAAEQLARLAPVLRLLRDAPVPLSVDTRSAEVARAALDQGADAVNDVSGLRHDPSMAQVVSERGASLVLMHSRGTPQDMASLARYADVAREVADELAASVAAARAAGCERLVVDPGFGFAKTPAQSLELLARLPELRVLGLPILVGLSRKSVVGHVLGRGGAPRPVGDRVAGSVGFALAAVARGASLVRVHDVRETADALACFMSGMNPGGP